MAYSLFERWNGSAWINEPNLIRLTVEDNIYTPSMLSITIADPSNTVAANYTPYQKVRLKEGSTKILLFYGKVLNILPENDGQYGQIVLIEARDNLHELSSRSMEADYNTGQNAAWSRKSALITSVINGYSTTHPAHSFSGNISTTDTNKLSASTVSEAGTRKWNFGNEGSGKNALEILKLLATADPHSSNREAFGYVFNLDYRGGTVNTVYSDFNYFKRGDVPASSATSSGLTVEYDATETNQRKSMYGDYAFETKNVQELITRIDMTYVDAQKKPQTLQLILVNTGAHSGTFTNDETITWSSGGNNYAAVIRLSGGSGSVRHVLISNFTSAGLAGLPGSTITGSSSTETATVNASSATPPGVLSVSLEYELTEVISASEFETIDEVYQQAFSLLYQANNNVERGEFRVSKWPYITITGTHTGSSNSSVLVDSAKNFNNFSIQPGSMVENTTDSTSAEISAVSSATTLAMVPSNLDWDTNDAYYLYKLIRAGMSIHVTNSRLSINKEMMVTRIQYDEGGGVIQSTIDVMSVTRGNAQRPTTNRKTAKKISAGFGANKSKTGQSPLSQMQFASTISFSETDYNTVQWTTGSLTYGDGTAYSISSTGNTGNMSNVPVYIYFDADTSLTALQTTTTHANVIGPNKTLLCTALSGATSVDPPQIRTQQGDSGAPIPKTFAQNGAPSTSATNPLKRGDMWFDTNDSNQVYRWNGSSWVTQRDATIAVAQSAAVSAQSTANSKNEIFIGSSASATSEGDLWVDTGNGSMLKRWNGSSWVDAESFLNDTWTNSGRTSMIGGKIETNLIILDKVTGSGANTGNIIQSRTSSPSTAGTGTNRILLSADGIFGYNSSNALQFSATQASGGTLLAGGGEIVLNADGILSGGNLSSYTPLNAGNSAIGYSFLIDAVSSGNTGGNTAGSTGVINMVAHNANSGGVIYPFVWYTTRDNNGNLYAKEQTRWYLTLPGQAVYSGVGQWARSAGTDKPSTFNWYTGGFTYGGGPGGNDQGGNTHDYRSFTLAAGSGSTVGTDIWIRGGNTNRFFLDIPLVMGSKQIGATKSIGLNAGNSLVTSGGVNYREVVLTGGKSLPSSGTSPWTYSDARNAGNVMYNFPSDPTTSNHSTFRGKVLTVVGTSGGTGASGVGTYTETNAADSSKTDTVLDLEWTSPVGSQNLFSSIAVSGQSNVVADAATDTLTLIASTGMTITTNATNDSITFVSTGNVGTVTSIATTSPIAGGTITGSGTITHVDTAGNKHIPTGGSTNDYLKYSASGTAVWAPLISSGTVNSGTGLRVAYYSTSGTVVDDHSSITFANGTSPSAYEVNIVDAVLDINGHADSRIIIPVGANKWAT